jgi:hypothetical protein
MLVQNTDIENEFAKYGLKWSICQGKPVYIDTEVWEKMEESVLREVRGILMRAAQTIIGYGKERCECPAPTEHLQSVGHGVAAKLVNETFFSNRCQLSVDAGTVTIKYKEDYSHWGFGYPRLNRIAFIWLDGNLLFDSGYDRAGPPYHIDIKINPSAAKVFAAVKEKADEIYTLKG